MLQTLRHSLTSSEISLAYDAADEIRFAAKTEPLNDVRQRALAASMKLVNAAGGKVNIVDMGTVTPSSYAAAIRYSLYDYPNRVEATSLSNQAAQKDAARASVNEVLLNRRNRGVFLREQVISDHDWNNGAFFSEVWKPLGVGDYINVWNRDPESKLVFALVLNRAIGDGAFCPRDQLLLRLYLDLISPAVDPEVDYQLHPVLCNLDANLVAVLRLLFTEMSEKQIGARLGINLHTLHYRIKQLYRRLDVTGRVELIVRYRSYARQISALEHKRVLLQSSERIPTYLSLRTPEAQ